MNDEVTIEGPGTVFVTASLKKDQVALGREVVFSCEHEDAAAAMNCPTCRQRAAARKE